MLLVPLFPVMGVPALAASTAGSPREALSCHDLVTGFDADGHVVLRFITNGDMAREVVTERSFGFDVLDATMEGVSEGTEGGIDMNIGTISRDGRPRWVYVDVYGEPIRGHTSFAQAKPFARRTPQQRLLTEAASYFVYMVDTRGRLNRWTTFETETGPYYYGKPMLIRRGMKGLRSLEWNGTMKVQGRRTDLVWATTRAGALIQIQIPVRKPEKNRVLFVKRRGFADVSGLSAGVCNNDKDIASLVTVERSNDRAKWFTLRRQTAPRSSPLVAQGRVARTSSWELRAIA